MSIIIFGIIPGCYGLYALGAGTYAIDKLMPDICFLECGKPPSPPDYDKLPPSLFFTDPDCLSACWQELRPGQTSRSDIETFLAQHGSFDHSSKYYSGRMGNGLYLEITFNGNDFVHLHVSGPMQMRLDDVLDQLGSPDYTLINRTSYGPTSTAEIHFYLYYPDQGYVFETQYWDENAPVTFCVEEEDIIYDAIVIRPGELASVLRDTYELPSNAHVENLVRSSQPWPGYTCIDVSEEQP